MTPNGTYTYGYDDNGNRTSVTAPSGDVHRFEYDATNQLTSYTPPGSAASHARSYNAEDSLESTGLPSGATVDFDFDAGRRPSGTTSPDGTNTFSYAGDTELPASLVRSPQGGASQTLDYEFDGALETSAGFSGAASGEFAFDYDDRFQLTNSSVNAAGETIDTPRRVRRGRADHQGSARSTSPARPPPVSHRPTRPARSAPSTPTTPSPVRRRSARSRTGPRPTNSISTICRTTASAPRPRRSPGQPGSSPTATTIKGS